MQGSSAMFVPLFSSLPSSQVLMATHRATSLKRYQSKSRREFRRDRAKNQNRSHNHPMRPVVRIPTIHFKPNFSNSLRMNLTLAGKTKRKGKKKSLHLNQSNLTRPTISSPPPAKPPNYHHETKPYSSTQNQIPRKYRLTQSQYRFGSV